MYLVPCNNLFVTILPTACDFWKAENCMFGKFNAGSAGETLPTQSQGMEPTQGLPIPLFFLLKKGRVQKKSQLLNTQPVSTFYAPLGRIWLPRLFYCVSVPLCLNHIYISFQVSCLCTPLSSCVTSYPHVWLRSFQ